VSPSRSGAPVPSFAHLLRLTDGTGIFEHATHAVPRLEHGYCVDDVARALIVVLREPDPPPPVTDLAVRYLAFLRYGMSAEGTMRNRMSHDRRWQDQPGTGDHWGRALWALGTAAADRPRSTRPSLADPALPLFERAATHRSEWPRAMAHAALGAAEVLGAHPGHVAATALLADTARLLAAQPAAPADVAHRGWPHGRLTYANAALPEVLLAAGALLGEDAWVTAGAAQLAWLLDVETRDGHLSPTPVGGWEPGEPRPGFDQQPIEVAALADACARAHEVTADATWLDGLRMAAGWFLGDNDVGAPLYDPVTGGGRDGLTPEGTNANQGAESTIAAISTFQHAQRLP
jgi:hypothetical protein